MKWSCQALFNPGCLLQTQMAGDSVQRPLRLCEWELVLTLKPYLLSSQWQIPLEKERELCKGTLCVANSVVLFPEHSTHCASLAGNLHGLERICYPIGGLRGRLNLERCPLCEFSLHFPSFLLSLLLLSASWVLPERANDTTLVDASRRVLFRDSPASPDLDAGHSDMSGKVLTFEELTASCYVSKQAAT